MVEERERERERERDLITIRNRGLQVKLYHDFHFLYNTKKMSFRT